MPWHRGIPLKYATVCYGFLKIVIWGKLFRKKWTLFWKFFKILKILKIRDSSFVALLILRHFI